MTKKHGGANQPPDPREHGSRELGQGTRGGPPGQEQRWPGRTDEMRPRPDHGEDSYRGTGRLRGRVALVTGGDSGIGRAVAIAFAREGAHVAFSWLSEEDDARETQAWIERADRRALSLQADLTRPEDCRRIVDQTIEELGGLHILVNNAGFQMEQERLEDIRLEQMERVVRTNLLATLLVTQVALRHMDPGAVILNTGSVTALEGNPSLMDYAATKAAIHNFTRSLARAVSDRGIRVNCVAPGPVWTPLIPSTFGSGHVEEFGATTAWGRPAQPAEIAPGYVFFASDDGRYCTGEILGITGRSTTR